MCQINSYLEKIRSLYDAFVFLRLQLLSDCPPLYQKKLKEQGRQDIVTRNKIKFERYGDLVDPTLTRT